MNVTYFFQHANSIIEGHALLTLINVRAGGEAPDLKIILGFLATWPANLQGEDKKFPKKTH